MANHAGRFAHFMGFGGGGGLAAGEPDKDETEDEKTRRAALTQDERDDEDEKTRRAALTQDERDKEDAKADDDDEEMHGASAAASARRRERARCAAIFSSPQAAGNPALACSLAFETTMTRQEALAVLASQPRRAAAPDRSAGNPDIGPGGKPATGAAAVQADWAKAFEAHGATPAKRPLLRG